MNSRLWLLTLLLLASFNLADAQQPVKIPRIGYISGTGNETNQGPYVAALRQGLRELGYIEGKNFTIEYRGAEGKPDREPSLAADLIERKSMCLLLQLYRQSLQRSRRPKLRRLS